MKYIKLFEKQLGYPEVGDYVLCEEEEIDPDYADLYEFLKTHIGKLVKITDKEDVRDIKYKYTVRFENINIMDEIVSYFSNNLRSFRRFEIKHWSKNKEDLEHIIDAKKYNL